MAHRSAASCGAGFDMRTGFALSGMSLSQVWWGCLGITTTLTDAELQLIDTAPAQLSDDTYNVIVQVLNEHFLDDGLSFPVAYRA